MRVLHLVTSLHFGGLERRMEILSKFPSQGNDVFFCALGGGGACQEQIVRNGGRATVLDSDVRIFRHKTLLLLIRHLRQTKPDLLHTHGCEANFYGALAGRIAGVKCIIGEEIGIPRLSARSRLAFRLIYRLCDAVIAMSPVVSEHLASESLVDPRKLRSVYNPVLLSDVRREAGAKVVGPVRFVYIGRLEAIKNPSGLISAFALLVTAGYRAELTIVGAGSLMEELQSQVSSLRLGDLVTLRGYCRNPMEVALEHHVAVQSSHTEGFSLALVEAMSCGLPAVATPVGGATALIQEGWNGWLARSSSVQHIYESMRAACRDAERIPEMGEKAADSVAGAHDAAQYSAKLDAFYRHEMQR